MSIKDARERRICQGFQRTWIFGNHREILPHVEHRQHRYLNNRAENSHQLTRQRERRMQGFKSPGHAQRFLSVYGPIAQHFRLRRHRLSASAYRQEMSHRFERWAEITGKPRHDFVYISADLSRPCRIAVSPWI
jgi:transposase-like protein